MHYQVMQGEFLSSPLNIRDANHSAKVANHTLYVPVISKTAHPPLGQTQGHLTSWKILVIFPAMLPV